MKKSLLLFLFLLGTLNFIMADSNVRWSYKINGNDTGNPTLEITAKISAGYHLYSQDNPEGGGSPLEFNFATEGCTTVGKPTADKAYKIEYNDIFKVDEHYYTGKVTFTQKLKPTSENWTAKVEIRGQYCNDAQCVPIDETHKFTGTCPTNLISKEEASKKESKESETSETEIEKINNIAEMVDSVQAAEAFMEPGANLTDIRADNWWDNVQAEIKMFEDNPEQQSKSLWYIFIAGFLAGLIALVTPCVWPMIPMTVSFFLKSNKSRRKSIFTAMVYGLSIIVIYVGLGLIVTVLFGASALNVMATSAGFNIAFFILLLIFAFSFMGGFELTLPAKWSNKIDAKVDSTTGYISIFFMAFTLCLVSFSCTGPIIGTLLVEAAATSDFVSPAIGMAGFAIALALPFSVFAMFPTMLKAVPKSGGWMNTVKVVLGFLELALALKFLSVADLAYGWRILDREVFLVLWIVIFALLGFYLLGKIRLPHDDEVEKVGVTRMVLAIISLSFALYMIPGLWGAPLKSISAFAPPMYTQDFNLAKSEIGVHSNDYDEGMQLAKELKKPVLIDFSGYGCVNCRKMEAAVFTNPDVKNMIDNDFVMITLMVDDRTPLPHPIEVKRAKNETKLLKTYGDKWSYLQETKFGATAQPFYVILDNEGKPLNHSYSYDEDVAQFIQFLATGLENYLKEDKKNAKR